MTVQTVQNVQDVQIVNTRKSLTLDPFGLRRFERFERLERLELLLGSDPIRLQRRLIAAWNLGIFILVGNHPTAFFDASEYVVVGLLVRDLETQRMNSAPVTHRQVPCRLFAGIEMLMKPISRRTVDTCFAPFDLDDFLLAAIGVRVKSPLLVPEQNIAHRLRADDDRTRTVVVRLVILADRLLAQVTD